MTALNNNRCRLSLHYFTEKNGEKCYVKIQKRTKNHILVSQQINPFNTISQTYSNTKYGTSKSILVEHSDNNVYKGYETVQSIDKEHNYRLVRYKEVCDKVNKTCNRRDFKIFEYNNYGTKIYTDLDATV